VEINAVRPDLSQQVHQFDRGLRRPYRLAKGVPANVADSPQPEGKFMFRFWFVRIAHVILLTYKCLALFMVVIVIPKVFKVPDTFEIVE
jgi:hypothetical protein